jgi:hypothetical protein
MITYYEVGKTRLLHEVVIAGTHDAGITGGGKNVQTQTLNILQQAMTGVRFFDIRVAAAVTSQTHGATGKPIAELRAFHADDAVTFKFNRNVVLKGGNAPVNVKQSKLAAGAFGLGLTTMLEQARDFVASPVARNEFLMLKFDKCTNWGHIADACEATLGASLYKGGGNLNNKSLDDLRGKVIVLFSAKGIGEMGRPRPGILRFKNLSGEGEAYEPVFEGLQYYGKGGTNPLNPLGKTKQNIKKQTKLMAGAVAVQNPEIVGMMYWTTTGLFESIKKRDRGMWDPPNISKMKALWGQGFGNFVDGFISLPSTNPMAKAQQRHRFFPNIVMIDFADHAKCKQIRDLNDLSASHLSALP